MTAAPIPYGQRDGVTAWHWRTAHVDPDKVRAWCAETGRPEPSARTAAIPRALRDAYVTERGEQDIPLAGDGPPLRTLTTGQLTPGGLLYVPQIGTTAIRQTFPLPDGDLVVALGWDRMAIIAAPDSRWQGRPPEVPLTHVSRACGHCKGRGYV